MEGDGTEQDGAPQPLPNLEPYVPWVRALADASFEREVFLATCEALGWRLDERASHESGTQFYVPEEPQLWLLVSHLYDYDAGKPPERVECAIAHLSYWEDFDEEFHDDPGEWQRQRDAFDAVFEQGRTVATSKLGPPLHEGRDIDSDGHRYAVWRGRTALLILQQCALDVQFGLEVNIWLHPWPETEPLPEFPSPLIEWLMAAESADEG